jgi:hypothetical protein
MRPDGVGHAQRLEQALSSERRDILPGRLLEHARSLGLLYQTVAPCTDWFRTLSFTLRAFDFLCYRRGRGVP